MFGQQSIYYLVYAMCFFTFVIVTESDEVTFFDVQSSSVFLAVF